MKKRVKVILTTSMLTMAAATTAFAASPDGTEAMSGSGMPQIEGQQVPGNGSTAAPEQPQMDGQQPQMNGQQPQMNGQQPQMNGQQPCMNGRGKGGAPDRISFESFLEDGTISQETYDAIKKYMDEHKPGLPEDAKEDEKSEPSEDNAADAKPGSKDEDRPDLLKDLLNDKVITQEEYDAMSKARTEKAADSGNTEKNVS